MRVTSSLRASEFCSAQYLPLPLYTSGNSCPPSRIMAFFSTAGFAAALRLGAIAPSPTCSWASGSTSIDCDLLDVTVNFLRAGRAGRAGRLKLRMLRGSLRRNQRNSKRSRRNSGDGSRQFRRGVRSRVVHVERRLESQLARDDRSLEISYGAPVTVVEGNLDLQPMALQPNSRRPLRLGPLTLHARRDIPTVPLRRIIELYVHALASVVTHLKEGHVLRRAALRG